MTIKYSDLIYVNKEIKSICEQLRMNAQKEIQRLNDENKELRMKMETYKIVLIALIVMWVFCLYEMGKWMAFGLVGLGTCRDHGVVF